MSRKPIRLMLVGLGPHAQRTYIPSIKKLQEKYGVELLLVIDLKEKEQNIKEYLKKIHLNVEQWFIDKFESRLPVSLEKKLDKSVEAKKINSIIISTEPLAHKCYANWALNQKLNILMDKPITTRRNVAININSAKGIEEDYFELLQKYKSLQKSKNTIFSINVQRRYHPGFRLVFQKIKEISTQTNCPVTSIQAMHSDGQWRLPSEIVNQDYHPYNVGYGKVSHSGYHIFDAVYSLYKASGLKSKFADEMEVVSSFVRPNGFIKQLEEKDYYNYFGKEYKKVNKFSTKKLNRLYESFGEIDASALVSLIKENEVIANVSINLLHNGFARRTWVTPGNDLYKGNGRVKHEYYNIQQGPFQNIQIHSYQSSDKHDTNTNEDYKLGGNNHFDIYIFRNIGMVGGNKTLEILGIEDLSTMYGMTSDQLIVEQTKTNVVEEFFSSLIGLTPKNQITSSIEDHLFPVSLMSSVYQSYSTRLKNKNPVIRKRINILNE